MIFHSTFVQNRLDEFHKEYPRLTFALREDDDTFVLILPSSFNRIPALDRVVVFHAVNDLLTEFRDAGIKVRLETDPSIVL